MTFVNVVIVVVMLLGGLGVCDDCPSNSATFSQLLSGNYHSVNQAPQAFLNAALITTDPNTTSCWREVLDYLARSRVKLASELDVLLQTTSALNEGLVALGDEVKELKDGQQQVSKGSDSNSVPSQHNTADYNERIRAVTGNIKLLMDRVTVVENKIIGLLEKLGDGDRIRDSIIKSLVDITKALKTQQREIDELSAAVSETGGSHGEGAEGHNVSSSSAFLTMNSPGDRSTPIEKCLFFSPVLPKKILDRMVFLVSDSECSFFKLYSYSMFIASIGCSFGLSWSFNILFYIFWHCGLRKWIKIVKFRFTLIGRCYRSIRKKRNMIPATQLINYPITSLHNVHITIDPGRIFSSISQNAEFHTIIAVNSVDLTGFTKISSARRFLRSLLYDSDMYFYYLQLGYFHGYSNPASHLPSISKITVNFDPDSQSVYDVKANWLYLKESAILDFLNSLERSISPLVRGLVMHKKTALNIESGRLMQSLASIYSATGTININCYAILIYSGVMLTHIIFMAPANVLGEVPELTVVPGGTSGIRRRGQKAVVNQVEIPLLSDDTQI